MSAVQENSKLQAQFGVPQWLAAGILIAALALVFVTNSFGHIGLFAFAASLILCADYVRKRSLAPVQLPSWNAPQDSPEPKARLSPITWVGLAVLAVSLIFFSRPRISAVLMSVSLCLFFFGRAVRMRS
jgi:hypothetical protein